MSVRGPNLRLEGSTLGPRSISVWREAVAPFWDVEIRKEDMPDFRGRSEVYHLGNAILGFTAASELRMQRASGLVARMGVDHIAAKIRMDGHAQVEIAGREAVMAPGDVCLLDLSQPLSLRSTDYRAITVIMPRALFPDGGFGLDGAHGTILRAATPFGALVSEHLKALGTSAPLCSAAESRAAAQATAILLAMGARTAGAADGLGRPIERAPVFLTIRRYIDAQIGSPHLGVEDLCRRFGLSRSGLYRLFAPLGGVAEHIRRRRLSRAYRDLTAAAHDGIRVSEIAYRYGYASPASFTQAFRAEFGVSPTDVKAGGVRPVRAVGSGLPTGLPEGDWDEFYDWVLKLDI